VYYWSAVAVDLGGATSQTVEVRTFVVEDRPVGDDDDSAGDDEPACGCETSAADGAPHSLWLLLLLVPALRRRR
jgi:MYXO-CTERM domain-containing protein